MLPVNTIRLVAFWLLNIDLAFLAGISSWTDWSLFGWAVGGSTFFVVWEAVQGSATPRNTWKRTGMVLFGVYLGLGLNQFISEKFGWNVQVTTIGISMLGFSLFGVIVNSLGKIADKLIEKFIK